MQTILFLCTNDDLPFLSHLKPILQGHCNLRVVNFHPTAVTEVVLKAKETGCTSVATTSASLLKMLLHSDKQVSLDDYAGSIISFAGVEFLILNPCEHLVTVSYGKFLYKRYFSKFLRPENFLPTPDFTWELFNPANTDSIIEYMAACDFISEDIETGAASERIITCMSFSGVHSAATPCGYEIRTVCIPFNDPYNIAVASVICKLECPKLFQNGKYDNAYLLRYGIQVENWAFDTANLFHSWYAELPKRLDFITSFTLRKWQYWKDESKTTDLMEYYAYNAKDSFATAIAWMQLLHEVPQWALVNYHQEFPLLFPCLLAEMIGDKIDQEFFDREEVRFNHALDQRLSNLRKMVGNSNYNPSSPKQTLALFAVLGSGDVKDSTPGSMDRVSFRHPLNMRILKEITSYREDRKLVTSYLRNYNEKTGEYKNWNGRNFFSLGPHGTDTGRLASRESSFWCGRQIQNISRDRDDISIRYGFVADEGFYYGECDYSQAEARDTAYLSGDTNLIKAVDRKDRDFHGHNASMFFGLPYEAIVASSLVPSATDAELVEEKYLEEWVHKTLDKAVRQLSKNTNHGSNYNMGPGVMLITMGIKNVIRARELLHLPTNWTLKQVCAYLLDRYAKTYPGVKGPWYDKVIADVTGSSMLVGPTNWTRFCFGDPSKSKRDLNRYVAHPPQSLNAMTLNKAYLGVFQHIQLAEPVDFKLGPQIHDSIRFQYRVGRIDLARQVQAEMRIPIEVTDTYGIRRTLIVPTDLKGEHERWSELKAIR